MKQPKKDAPKKYQKPVLIKKEQSKVFGAVCGHHWSCGEQVRWRS